MVATRKMRAQRLPQRHRMAHHMEGAEDASVDDGCGEPIAEDRGREPRAVPVANRVTCGAGAREQGVGQSLRLLPAFREGEERDAGRHKRDAGDPERADRLALQDACEEKHKQGRGRSRQRVDEAEAAAMRIAAKKRDEHHEVEARRAAKPWQSRRRRERDEHQQRDGEET